MHFRKLFPFTLLFLLPDFFLSSVTDDWYDTSAPITLTYTNNIPGGQPGGFKFNPSTLFTQSFSGFTATTTAPGPSSPNPVIYYTLVPQGDNPALTSIDASMTMTSLATVPSSSFKVSD